MTLKRVLAMALCLVMVISCVPATNLMPEAQATVTYTTIEAENTEYAVWNRYTNAEVNEMYSGGSAAAGAPSGIYPYWDKADDSTEDLAANFLDKSNTPYVAYYVEAPADGTYSIKMKAQILPSSSADKRFEDTSLYYGAFYVNGKSYPALYENSSDYYNNVKGKALTTQTVEVELVKGINTIICIGITEEQDYSSSNSNWANIDCLMVESSLIPVKAQQQTLYAGNAPFIYGYTTINKNGHIGDGGWDDNTIPIDTMNTSNVSKLRSYTYTVNAPADGFYDITACYNDAGNGSDTRAIGLLVDGVTQAREFKHLDNTHTSGGSVNLSVYLTAGDHVLTITAPAKRTADDDCGTGDASTTKNVAWFSYNELYLYGGLTQSVIQSNPQLSWWYAEAEYKDEGYALWHTYSTTETNTDAKRDYNGTNYPDKGTGKVIGGGNTINNYSLAQLQVGLLDKATASGVTVYVDAPAAGTYTFKARYRLNNPGIWDSSNKTWTEDPYSVFMVNGDFGAQAFFDKNAQYNWTYDTYETTLTLREGVNEITFIPMTADQRKSGSDWVNVDCIFVDTQLQVVKVPYSETVTPNQGVTHLYENITDTYVGNGVYDAAANAGINLAELGEEDLHNLPFVVYTVEAPAAGWYEITTNYKTDTTGTMGYLIDGVAYTAEQYSTHADVWVYLTAGTHTVIATCLLPADAAAAEGYDYSWTDLYATTFNGGLTLAAAQKNPLATVPVRLEAEDGVIGRYTTTSEAGKSGTVVGGINKDTTNMQTFEDMQARGLVDKSGIPYVSYMVNAPEAGNYTLYSIYRVVMNSGYDIADYYMTVSVNDKDFYKMAYAPYASETNGWASSETVVKLEKGYNVIRMIPLNADNYASVSWLDQDYIEILGAEPVTPVVQTPNYFQSGEAQYYNGYTTVNTGATYAWATSYLGGIERISMTYDALDHTTLYELAWVSYTLEIPADGYYDMHTTINTGGAATGYLIMMIDGQKYKVPTSEVTEGFKKNKQNLTTYLTAGTHTILVSALCESGATWCDIAALTVYGEGVKLAETQVDPATLLKVPEGLIDGSVYSLSNGVLTICGNVDVLTLKSNFHGSENIAVTDAQGNALADSATVTSGCKVSYASGTAYTVNVVFKGDLNGDGKIDIRDLKLVNEYVLTGSENIDKVAADVDNSGAVGAADVAAIREHIFAGTSAEYVPGSIGPDAILSLGNPVGRLIKHGSALYMEASASNFTITGDLQGDVYITVMHGHGINDANVPGLFVEIDGETVNYIELPVWYEQQTVKVASGLSAGTHTIQVSKSVDSKNGGLYVYSISYNGNLETTESKARKIQFIGDSITAGFGVVTASKDPLGIVTDGTYTNKTYSYYSYANVTADALGADYYSIANGGWYFSSSDTADIENKSITRIYDLQSMLMDLGTYDAVNAAWKPDAVVVNLGTNDATLTDSDGNLVITREQYITDVAAILDQVRAANPNAVIVWAYGAMGTTGNMTEGNKADWIQEALTLYNADKSEAMKVTYIELPAYQDGLWSHPSVAGQQAIGQALADALADLMGWN